MGKDTIQLELDVFSSALGRQNLDLNRQSLADKLDAAVKHQDIIYRKTDIDECIYFKDGRQIDFLEAASRMEKVSVCNACWGESNTHYDIGFLNRRTSQILSFIRIDENNWSARAEANPRYYWGARADTGAIMNLLRLFFEESPWFNSIGGWIMKKYKS